MKNREKRELLNMRLKNIIETQCDSIGCNNCSYKHYDEQNEEDGCEATKLNLEVIKLELEDIDF
jgi:hypothetical protein